MKKNSCLVVLLFLSTSIFFSLSAQTILKGIPYVLSPAGKGEYVYKQHPFTHSIEGFKLVGNTLEVYGRSQRLGLIATTGFSNGNKYSPVVQVSSFDLDTGVPSLQSFPVHISDLMNQELSYTVFDAFSKKNIGSDKTDVRVAEIIKKYPSAFPSLEKTALRPEVNYMEIAPRFSAYDINTVTQTQNIDSLLSSGRWSYRTKRNKVTVEKRPPFEGEYKDVPWEQNVYNPTQKNFTYVIGANRKELKNQFYKEIAYITVDENGKLLNQPTVKFDYTKEHWYFALANNVEQSTQQVVAVLGDKSFMGKQNDPVKCKYNVVALNPDGSLFLTKEFVYGEKKIEFNPTASFVKNNKLYLISLNNTKATFDLFVFDAVGEMTVESIAASDVAAMTYANGNMGVAKSLGLTYVAGRPDYKQLGIYTLENGNTMLLLESVLKKSIPNPNPSTPGTMGSGFIDEITYKALVGLEFSNDGKLKGQYIVNKEFTNDKSPTTIEEVVVVQNKLLLLTVDKAFPYKNLAKQNFTDVNTYLLKGCEEQCKPALIVLHTDEKKVLVNKPIENTFITLYGTGSYILQKEKNTVIYVGMKDGLPSDQIEIQVCTFAF